MALTRRIVVLCLRWVLAGRRRRPRVEAELRRLAFRLVAVGPGPTVSVADRSADRVADAVRFPLRGGDLTFDLPADGVHPADRLAFGPRDVHRLVGVVHGGTGLVFVGDAMVRESGGITQTRGRLPAVHWTPREYRRLAAVGGLGAAPIAAPILPVGRTLGRNYFHWLLESLPTVVRAAEVVPGTVAVLPADAPAFAVASLAALDLPAIRDDAYRGPGPIVLVDPPRTNWPHPDDLDALVARVDAALGPADPMPGPPVYVSRRDDARALRGEAALEEQLEAAGFTVFRPRAWVDDVRLFRTAGLIVGPHGAGLANAVLAQSGARLVELSTPRCRNPLFRRLAALRGLTYTHVDLDSTEAAPDGDAEPALTALGRLGLV